MQIEPTPELLARFWSKVEKTDNCWIWKAAKSKGYGQFGYNGKVVHVYRFVYELLRGEIPLGIELDHLCRNKACVNPDHLEAVTHAENVLRGNSFSAKNARKLYCVNGHEFTPENTYIRNDNIGRRCRACHREQAKNYRLGHERTKL